MKRRFLKLGVLTLTALSCVGLTSCDFSFGNSSNTSEEEIEYTELTLVFKSKDGLINFSTITYLEKGKKWKGVIPEIDGYKLNGWFSDKEMQFPLISLKTQADKKTIYGLLLKKSTSDDSEDNTKDDNSNSDEEASSDSKDLLATLKSDCYKYMHLDKNQNKSIESKLPSGTIFLVDYNAKENVFSGNWVSKFGKELLNINDNITHIDFLTLNKMYISESKNGTVTRRYYKENSSDTFDSFIKYVNDSGFNFLFSVFDFFTFEENSTTKDYKASLSYTLVNGNPVPDSNGKYTITIECKYENNYLTSTKKTPDDILYYKYCIPTVMSGIVNEEKYLSE